MILAIALALQPRHSAIHIIEFELGKKNQVIQRNNSSNGKKWKREYMGSIHIGRFFLVT